MPEPTTLDLQRSLASLILEAEPPELDALGCREGLLAYRDLVRDGLADPLETLFPVTVALLEAEDAWTGCLDAFLAARCVTSHHHRDIAPTFLGWLADTAWGRDPWPWLLELAHSELLETLVYRAEDVSAPPDLAPSPAPGARVVLDPAAQVVAYTHAVHRATEECPRPEAGATYLLAYRDEEGLFQLLELTPATAALLVDPRPLGEVLAALGEAESARAFELLENLRKAGAIAGFRDNLSLE
jgi:hypothetical protein